MRNLSFLLLYIVGRFLECDHFSFARIDFLSVSCCNKPRHKRIRKLKKIFLFWNGSITKCILEAFTSFFLFTLLGSFFPLLSNQSQTICTHTWDKIINKPIWKHRKRQVRTSVVYPNPFLLVRFCLALATSCIAHELAASQAPLCKIKTKQK